MELSRRIVIGGLAATTLHLGRSLAASPVADGVTVLEAAPGRLALQPKPKGETAVWAYDGQVPGPLLRVRKGQEVRVRLVNKLTQPTTLSWHGVRIANAMDGVAGLTQAAVPPGGTFDYRFTPPDAGLYWYHPHADPDRAEQTGRGLYGLLIVDEPAPPAVDQDHLLVIDDWSLDGTGQIRALWQTEAAGPAADELVTINSKPVPGEAVVVAPGARLRLRFVNVSARVSIVAFGGMSLSVVAIDGQPSELFQPAGALPIGPGARFEVIADVTGDATKPPSLSLRAEDGRLRPLMTFTVRGQRAASRGPIAAFAPNPLLPTRIPLEKAIKPRFEIAAATGPGAAKPSNTAAASPALGGAASGFAPQPLFKVRRGGAVSLAFVNTTAAVQQMHVHGHVFRVLHDLDDGWDPYWRDSVLIAPGHTKHVAFIADNPGKWAIDSLMPGPQPRGLAAWFEVGER